MHTYQGRCHCGAIGFKLRGARTPDQCTVCACQCSFCRAHGARTTSDTEASVHFVTPDESRLNRYRFALKSADFYACRNCGVYVASAIGSPSGRFATLNVNVISPLVEVPAAARVTYDSEMPAQKRARREQQWTPVTDIA